jgi:riboflavin kinase / FMN adenylyltransferase
MKVHHQLQDLPSFVHPVLTIGTFDGVHLGHRSIIKQLIQVATQVGGQSVLITFEPHPRTVINPNNHQVNLLTTLHEKISLLSELGLHHLVVVPFTPAFRQLDAYEYIKSFLVNNFKPHTIIIGYDHQFGSNRLGNYTLLQQYALEFNYKLIEIPKQIIDTLAVSSTKIRNLLLAGDVLKANEMLSYNYLISGTVIHGDARGRTIGYPTANVQVHHSLKLLPSNGVYAVQATIQGQQYGGMMNIGTRPTIEDTTKRSIEVHFFNFNQQIYDEYISINIVARLRNELKFNSLNELVSAIKQDEIDAKKILNL